MDDLVLVEQGVCTVAGCGGTTDAADGLSHYHCARGHEAAPYRLVDTYAMDARLAWRD